MRHQPIFLLSPFSCQVYQPGASILFFNLFPEKNVMAKKRANIHPGLTLAKHKSIYFCLSTDLSLEVPGLGLF
jgi:hypothetical protein